MAPNYKVSYFPIQGLAEPIRWMLSFGGIDFEDNRINKEDWVPKFKNATPFGKVPTLEINGTVYHQHSAICRHLAKDLNLVGKTNNDAFQADIIVDTINDFRFPLAMHHYEPDAAAKETKRITLQGETVPYYLDKFEKIVKENNGYFVNGQLTWADIYFIAFSDYLELMSGNMDFFKDRPFLTALKNKVLANPGIKAWVAKRPANAY